MDKKMRKIRHLKEIDLRVYLLKRNAIQMEQQETIDKKIEDKFMAIMSLLTSYEGNEESTGSHQKVQRKRKLQLIDSDPKRSKRSSNWLTFQCQTNNNLSTKPSNSPPVCFAKTNLRTWNFLVLLKQKIKNSRDVLAVSLNFKITANYKDRHAYFIFSLHLPLLLLPKTNLNSC